MSIHNNPVSNDALTESRQIKTVECQLEMTFNRIAVTEANIELFGTMLRLGLATNDVKNFIHKQSNQKRVLSKPDFKVQKSAMKSKFSDACAYLKRLKRQRDTLKARIVKKFSSRKSYGRKIIDGLVDSFRSRREIELAKARKKIEFYREKSKIERETRSAPAATKEILSNVSLFKDEQNSIIPLEPEQPFICDPSIKLSDCEKQILAKGPKFMVRQDLDPSEFELELEKMVAKCKYDEMFNGREDDITSALYPIE